jgi:hypothetical protein
MVSPWFVFAVTQLELEQDQVTTWQFQVQGLPAWHCQGWGQFVGKEMWLLLSLQLPFCLSQ